jgi:hypothetical protein
MLNKIKQTLNENDSQLELITIKRKKTMNKETNKTTSINIGCAKDIFKLAQRFLDSNEHIESFQLVDDDFKISKEKDGSKSIQLLGFESYIKSIRTTEKIPNGTTTRSYTRVDGDYKLSYETTYYDD